MHEHKTLVLLVNIPIVDEILFFVFLDARQSMTPESEQLLSTRETFVLE